MRDENGAAAQFTEGNEENEVFVSLVGFCSSSGFMLAP
jgi:hypothetical protein